MRQLTRNPDMAKGGGDTSRPSYDVAADSAGQLMWYDPFYMKYSPGEKGNFNGQMGYA